LLPLNGGEQMINVLVVDDEENILWLLKEGLSDSDIHVLPLITEVRQSIILRATL